MATVASLLVGMGADVPGLRRDLAESQDVLKQFARGATGALGSTNLFGNLDTQAAKAAQQLLTTLQRDFAAGITNAREELARGIINPAEFGQTARAATEVFNRELAAGIDRLSAANLISTRVRAGLVSQFREVGIEAGVAMGQGLARAEPAVAATTRSLTALGNTGPHVVRGMNMVRSGMQAVAAQAIGVTGSLGSVLSGVLMLGVGSVAVTGIVAGLGLAAIAYQHLTQKAKDAAAELEKTRIELARAGQLRLNPVADIDQQLGKDRAGLAEINARIRSAQDAIQRFAHISTAQLANPELVVAMSAAADRAIKSLSGLGLENSRLTASIFENEQRRKEALAGSATGQNAADVQATIRSLQDQAAAIGQSTRAITLAALQKKGASLEDLKLADAALRSIAANEAQAKSFQLLQAHVSAVVTILDAAVAAQQDFSVPLHDAQASYADIQRRIEAIRQATGDTGALTDAQRTRLAALTQDAENLRKAIAAAFVDPVARPISLLQLDVQGPAQSGTVRIREAAEAARLERLISTELRIQGDVTAQNTAEVKRFKDQLDAVRSVIAQLKPPPITLDTGLIDQVSRDVERQLTPALEAAQHPVDHLLASVAQIGTALEGVIQTGAFDGIGESARQQIQSIISLVRAIEQVQAAAALAKATPLALADVGNANVEGGGTSLAQITGIIGAIGAGIGLLSSILGGGGPSASDVLLQQNNQALEDLREQLKLNVAAVSTLVEAQKALTRLNIPKIFVAGGPAQGNTAAQIAEVNREIASFGLTFADLEAVAKHNGLDLLDSKGHLVVGAFQQVIDVLGLTITSVTQFGKTLDDQKKVLDAHNKIFQIASSPTQGIADQGTLLSQFAPKLFSQLFAGIDTTTAAGRDALRTRIKAIFTEIQSGLLPAGDLGKLTDVNQVIDIILGISDGLDAMGKNLTAFNSTLDAQRSRLDLQQALTGNAATPTTAIQEEIALLQKFAPALGAAFQNINLATADGRAALRKSLQHLFDLADQGLITQAQLGGLDSVDQLIAIITAIVGPLNSMSDAVDSVTKTLQNVPEGFRVAFQRFNVQDIVDSFAPNSLPVPIKPPPPPPGGDDLATFLKTLVGGGTPLSGAGLDQLNKLFQTFLGGGSGTPNSGLGLDTITKLLQQFTTTGITPITPLIPVEIGDSLTKALLQGTPSFDDLSAAILLGSPSMDRLSAAITSGFSGALVAPNAGGPAGDIQITVEGTTIAAGAIQVDGSGADPEAIAGMVMEQLQRKLGTAIALQVLERLKVESLAKKGSREKWNSL